MVFEVIRGHLTTKLGVFGVIWGQNSKFLRPGQTINQNEALSPVINIKWFLRSSDPKLGAFWVIWSQNLKIIQEETGPQIASREARVLEEEIGPKIASSEARALEYPGPPIASSEARG